MKGFSVLIGGVSEGFGMASGTEEVVVGSAAGGLGAVAAPLGTGGVFVLLLLFCPPPSFAKRFARI